MLCEGIGSVVQRSKVFYGDGNKGNRAFVTRGACGGVPSCFKITVLQRLGHPSHHAAATSSSFHHYSIITSFSPYRFRAADLAVPTAVALAEGLATLAVLLAALPEVLGALVTG